VFYGFNTIQQLIDLCFYIISLTGHYSEPVSFAAAAAASVPIFSTFVAVASTPAFAASTAA
jgi:hypothetical protein